jgi:hypothetical protein
LGGGPRGKLERTIGGPLSIGTTLIVRSPGHYSSLPMLYLHDPTLTLPAAPSLIMLSRHIKKKLEASLSKGPTNLNAQSPNAEGTPPQGLARPFGTVLACRMRCALAPKGAEHVLSTSRADDAPIELTSANRSTPPWEKVAQGASDRSPTPMQENCCYLGTGLLRRPTTFCWRSSSPNSCRVAGHAVSWRSSSAGTFCTHTLSLITSALLCPLRMFFSAAVFAFLSAASLPSAMYESSPSSPSIHLCALHFWRCARPFPE